MIEQRTHQADAIPLSRDPLLGEVIDRYRLVEAIGDGAMANVYRAQHTTLTDRRYAIKVLRPAIARKPQVAARFRRESKILSQLEHPNIISVIDAGTTSHGLLYMVLDYAEGPTLKDIMRSKEKMSYARTVDIISQILSALKRTHSLGYIHRDIKPDNIVITQSEGKDLVKILDFGIAGMADADPDMTRLTEVNRICGTPHYMAPEQASASEILAPVDIYAVGAILYEILEGKPPFVGPMTEVLVQKLVADPKPPSDNTGLGEMAMAMLARDPNARPTAARSLARLRSWNSEPIQIPSVVDDDELMASEFTTRTPRWFRTLGQTLVAASIAAVCAYAGFSMVRAHQNQEQMAKPALMSFPLNGVQPAAKPIVLPKNKSKTEKKQTTKKRKGEWTRKQVKSQLRQKHVAVKTSKALGEPGNQLNKALARLDFIEPEASKVSSDVVLHTKDALPDAQENPTVESSLRSQPADDAALENQEDSTSQIFVQGKSDLSAEVAVVEQTPTKAAPSEAEIQQARANLDEIRRKAFSERRRVSAYRMPTN